MGPRMSHPPARRVHDKISLCVLKYACCPKFSSEVIQYSKLRHGGGWLAFSPAGTEAPPEESLQTDVLLTMGSSGRPGGCTFLLAKSGSACLMERLMRPRSSTSFTTTGTFSPFLYDIAHIVNGMEQARKCTNPSAFGPTE